MIKHVSIYPIIQCKALMAYFVGHGKPGKSWNFTISFSRPGKSWKMTENNFSENTKQEIT